MKLTKRLLISNQEVHLASNKVSLKLSLGGKAIFTFKHEREVKPRESVRFDIGYKEQPNVWFEGYIEKVQPAPNGFQKIVVKEYAGILSHRWTISIEHPSIEQILERLTEQTGLIFLLPDADYSRKIIPNFVHDGDGYQALNAIGRAFEIDDFCWYQDLDQRVFVGSYKDSRFYNKNVEVPAHFSIKQLANSISFVPFPMIRPGHVVNGYRITRLDLIDDEMTAHWKASEKEVSPSQREILDLFPELTAGYHLPRFGRVEAVRDNANVGQVADPFRPRYAIDIQLINENMQPDLSVPVYRSVPMPVHMSGSESGLLAYPLEGTIVEIAFAYGRSDLPLIRGIYGRDYALPEIAPGEQLQQQREEVSRRIDAAGNITDKTDQTLTTESFERVEKATHYKADLGSHELNVDGHSKENIIGKKVIEALGAIELLAGDNLELGSLGNMQIATAGDLVTVIGKLRNIVIAQDDKLKVMGNRLEVIEKDWEASAKNMRFTADLITMNGGKGVVQGDCICSFTGLPHTDLSSTVKAGK